MTVTKAKIGGIWTVISGYASNVHVGPSQPVDPNMQLWIDTDAVLTSVPWTNFTFIDANWRSLNASPIWQTAYRKVGDRVEMRGLVERLNSTTAGTVSIAQMPAGFYVSNREARFSCVRSDVNTAGDMVISTSGLLRFNSTPPIVNLPAGSWLSLDGISYSVTA